MENTRFLYFSAEWCGPCKAFKPLVEKLEKVGYPVYFVDIESDPVLAESHQIRSVPAIVVEQDGRVVERMVGVQDPVTLAAKFELYSPLENAS
jgi:thioredoxin-like negative regulator of GroEL